MELTAEEYKLDAYSFVRHVMDNKALTDDEVEYILWEKTSFPMAEPGEIKRQLLEIKEHGYDTQ